MIIRNSASRLRSCIIVWQLQQQYAPTSRSTTFWRSPADSRAGGGDSNYNPPTPPPTLGGWTSGRPRNAITSASVHRQHTGRTADEDSGADGKVASTASDITWQCQPEPVGGEPAAGVDRGAGALPWDVHVTRPRA